VNTLNMKSILLKFCLLFALAALVATARADAVLDDMAKSLEEARANYAQFQTRYAETHPTMVEARAKIQELENQIAARAAQAGESPARERKPTAVNPGLISVDFPGGTFADLLKAITNSGGVAFNVVGEKAVLATDLPAFSIRNALPLSVAAALNQLIAPRGLNLLNPGNYSPEVYVLSERRPASFNEPVVFDSFQLASYLEKQGIDDIVGAIHTAWELNSVHKADALQLKFHPPTKLLLVSGSPEAVNIARQVVSTLMGAPEKGPITNSATPAATMSPQAAEQIRLDAVAREVEQRKAKRGDTAKPK
jgi:hypothetical protein